MSSKGGGGGGKMMSKGPPPTKAQVTQMLKQMSAAKGKNIGGYGGKDEASMSGMSGGYGKGGKVMTQQYRNLLGFRF